MESNIVYSLEPKFQRLKNEPREDVRRYLKMHYEDRVKRSGMSMTWDQHSIDILDAVATWLGTPHKTGLLLFGGYGTGKTTMLSCLEDISGGIISTPDMSGGITPPKSSMSSRATSIPLPWPISGRSLSCSSTKLGWNR